MATVAPQRSQLQQGASGPAGSSTSSSNSSPTQQSEPSIRSPQPKAASRNFLGCFGWGDSSMEGVAVPVKHLQSQLSLDGVIHHFNWDDQAMTRSCMDTLVAALQDDPVSAYFSGQKRQRFVKDEVKGYIKALPGATNFISTPDSKAVALWQLLPQETPANELLAGWTRFLRVPLRLWPSLLRLELHYEHAHEAIASAVGSYYYLSFIGTHPDARGKGYGSLLLKHITDRADAEGRWCLLEATSERSQALYARHGFETYEAYRCNNVAPPVYLMKRAPATAAAPRAVAAANLAAAAVSSKVLKAAPAAAASEQQQAVKGGDGSNDLLRGNSIKVVAVAVGVPVAAAGGDGSGGGNGDTIAAVHAPSDAPAAAPGGDLVRVASSCSSCSSSASSDGPAVVAVIEEVAAAADGTQGVQKQV